MQGFTQSLDSTELRRLQSTIQVKLVDNEGNYSHGTRPSELIFVVLKVNSVGKVESIHILGDEKNRGTSYIILSKSTPDIFSRFTFNKCKGKTISIPVISISPEKYPDYVNNLNIKDSWKNISILIETENSVFLSPIQYETSVPIVDTIKKWPKEVDSLRQKAAKNN